MSKNNSNMDELEYYLSNHFNLSVYQVLQDLAYFDPLEFFKLFYALVRLVYDGEALTAISRVNDLEITGGLKLFIAYHLQRRIRADLADVDDSIIEKVSTGLSLIERHYEHLETMFPPDIVFLTSPSPDERARALVAIDKAAHAGFDDLISRTNEKSDRERLIDLCARQSERERIEETLVRMTQNSLLPDTKTTKRNPDFTTTRQVLALRYLLKHLGVNNVDKTVQARFIEFLTGKNLKDIYDKIRDETLTYTRKGTDAEYVKDWFRQLGLTEIVEIMDSDQNKNPEKI